MRGVLSPGGTRLAPTEAARRPVACCFERPEQLRYPEKRNRADEYTERYRKERKRRKTKKEDPG